MYDRIDNSIKTIINSWFIIDWLMKDFHFRILDMERVIAPSTLAFLYGNFAAPPDR